MFDWLLTLVVATARPELAPALAMPPVAQNHLPLAEDARTRVPVRRDQLRVGIATDATAVVLADRETGAVLFGKRSDEPLAIASLTKMMTVLVALERRPDLDAEVTIQPDDVRRGGIEQIYVGDTVTVRDALSLALVASSNTAAATLAHAAGLTPEAFVARMNAKAKELGMAHATFVEPTGLEARNRASAHDVALMLRAGFEEPIVRAAAKMGEYRFTTVQGKSRAARATDELLGATTGRAPYRFLGGKTGYLDDAGYCFGAIAEDAQGDALIAVALGAATRDGRFAEVKKLLSWGFNAFDWPGRDVAVK
jgi:D-alanyl-D-alanine endopeptidase (penicillin-binding protein 7)